MSWPTTIAHMKILGQTILQLLIENTFTSKGHSDLDLWPSDLKNIWSHLVVMSNHHSWFEDSRLIHLAVIDRKRFYN